MPYISWSSDFACYLEDYLMYEHHSLGLWVSMTRSLTSNKYRSLWPIFHGPVILRYILKTIWCMKIILRDYGSVWPDVWPKINVGLCDLYFMVQWFCLMSPRLFDAWVSYFQIMRQCDPNFDLKVNISQHDLCFMVQWFYLISLRLFDALVSYIFR